MQKIASRYDMHLYNTLFKRKSYLIRMLKSESKGEKRGKNRPGSLREFIKRNVKFMSLLLAMGVQYWKGS